MTGEHPHWQTVSQQRLLACRGEKSNLPSQASIIRSDTGSFPVSVLYTEPHKLACACSPVDIVKQNEHLASFSLIFDVVIEAVSLKSII